MKENAKSTRLGWKIWFSAIVFGLVGQIAWVVENMYFATFAQDIYTNSGNRDMAYVVTTLMVIFSAITATVTTIFAGGLCDKLGKRKVFVSYGYIAWGLTIMLFAAIPMRADSHTLGLLGFLLVLFDCVMTFAGSTAYDAAFNTWTTDVTDDTNRGKVNTVLSVLPVFATVIVFIGLGSLYKPTNESNWLFFIVLGIIPIVAGILAIFMMKDSSHIVKNQNPDFLKETFYGFRKQASKTTVCCTSVWLPRAYWASLNKRFFSYLINFVQNTLELGDNFVVPLAVVIIGAAVFTGVMGVLFDKLGRKHFYLPLLTVIVACTLIVYLMEFMPKAAWLPVLYVAGIFMLGSILSLSAALMASFQDYIPTGTEGRFQGVRMCFNVLLPMIIGPLITLIIGLSDVDTSAAGFTPPFKIFLAASIVAVLAFLPLYFVRKDSDRLRLTLSEKRENAAAKTAQTEESAEITEE